MRVIRTLILVFLLYPFGDRQFGYVMGYARGTFTVWRVELAGLDGFPDCGDGVEPTATTPCALRSVPAFALN